MPMAVMLHSLCRHLPETTRLKLYLLYSDISPRLRRRVESCLRNQCPNVSVRWLKPNAERFEGALVSGHVSIVAYYRLLLPTLLPDVERILYLDCDLLIRKSIVPLWEIGAHSTSPIHAVQGFGAPYAGDRFGIPDHASHGIPANAPCFNSGVMLMNLETWRRDGWTEKVLKHLPDSDSSRFALFDQYALNIAFYQHWGALDPTWNRMNTIERFAAWEDTEFKRSLESRHQELLDDPAIVHFTGPHKPWVRSARRHRFSGEYVDAMEESGWFNDGALRRVLWRFWTRPRLLDQACVARGEK